ncbi:MAG TPA: YchJ family metal-binding protein [Rhodocyclaceae bacterium]|nr:YchJ family metal-binding protein [Rhodocyclaceae bacterium]
MKKAATQQACPCGKGLYADCCEPLHAGSAATTAEALMRSRYSAYVLQLANYLQATWHVSTRPAEMTFDDEQTKWLGLDLRAHAQHGDDATVEFIARYKINGRAQRLHEISRFVREDGRWYYLDGELLPK